MVNVCLSQWCHFFNLIGTAIFLFALFGNEKIRSNKFDFNFGGTRWVIIIFTTTSSSSSHHHHHHHHSIIITTTTTTRSSSSSPPPPHHHHAYSYIHKGIQNSMYNIRNEIFSCYICII